MVMVTEGRGVGSSRIIAEGRGKGTTVVVLVVIGVDTVIEGGTMIGALIEEDQDHLRGAIVMADIRGEILMADTKAETGMGEVHLATLLHHMARARQDGPWNPCNSLVHMQTYSLQQSNQQFVLKSLTI